MKIGFKDEPGFSFLDMGKATLYLLGDLKKKYLLCSGVVFLVLFYDLVPTLIIAKIIDFFTNYTTGGSLRTFYFYVIFLVIANSSVAIIRLSVKKILSNTQSRLAYLVKVKGFERLLDFSLRWHDSENTGNKVQKIQSGIDALNDTQMTLSNTFFPHLTAALGTLGFFLFLQPIFFIYCMAYVGIFVLIQKSFYKLSLDLNLTYNTLTEKSSGTYYEGLSNILSIKTLGVKNDFKNNILSKEEMLRDFKIKMTELYNQKWKLFRLLDGLTLGGMLLLTGHGYIKGSITLGSILIIFNYFQKLSGALTESTSIFERLIRAKVSLARMMPIFWDDENIKKGELDFPKKWESISISDASFNYRDTKDELVNESQENGLKDVTLKINRFEKVGVVGKSGSGKSTLAKIMLGLYEFKKGTFEIGGVNFYDIKHDNVTSEIALVLQDSEMFNLSLKENITLMRAFDENLFKRALRIAELNELVSTLPEGVETLIGEKGYRLSGGERQRIGIARAIYKDPQILVLDEATSSLDGRTESLIQEALEKDLAKKTVISIAHRVSTLKNVDRVVVFNEGKIVEEGTFLELSKNKNSEFFKIYSSQTKRSKKEN